MITSHLPRTGEQIPYFQIRTLDGQTIDPWQFKQRRNLLVYFPSLDDEPLTAVLQDFGDQCEELQWHEATLLVVLQDRHEQDQALELLPDACYLRCVDSSGEVRGKFGLDAHTSAVVLADRFGAVYASWEARGADVMDVEEIMSTLKLLEAQCPECGGQGWAGPAE